MARITTTVQLDAQLHERLMALKMHVSVMLRHGEHSLGLGPMLGLLMDHWEQSPPPMEWLVSQSALYPKRGRPRRSEKADMSPRVALRVSQHKGHDLIWPQKTSKAAWRIYYCKHCNMNWSTWDFSEPPATCPKKLGFSSLYVPKVWTKSELLACGFEADEVAWVDDVQASEERSSPDPGGPTT